MATSKQRKKAAKEKRHARKTANTFDRIEFANVLQGEIPKDREEREALARRVAETADALQLTPENDMRLLQMLSSWARRNELVKLRDSIV